MARATTSTSQSVPITVGIKILGVNPNRVMYSIQNLDAANYIAVASHSQVTAGVNSGSEGQHITAGQSVSDDDDKDAVWAVANTAACIVAVLEVTQPVEGVGRANPRLAPARAGRVQQRSGTRQGP